MAEFEYTLFEAAAAAIADEGHTCGPEHVTDHVARGLARLLQQFKGQPRIEALLTGYLEQVQELEDSLWDLRTLRSLDLAEGEQLDRLGEIVGQARGGLDDDNYRQLIRARIQANRSDGQADRLLLIARLVLSIGDSEPILTLTEGFPASVVIQNFDDIDPVDPNVVFGLLHDAKAAGVRLQFIYQTVASNLAFQFSSDASLDSDVQQGMGDTGDPFTGGYLVGVLG